MRRLSRQWYVVLAFPFLVILLSSMYLLLGKPASELNPAKHEPSAQTVLRDGEGWIVESIGGTDEFFESNRSVVWVDTKGTKVDEKLIPSYKEEVQGAAIVQISHLLDRLEAGDTIVLTVPQENQSYETQIKEVKRSLGVTSYSGRVVESEIPLSFLITVGKSSVFANFSTPHAAYELWGNRSYALLMDYAKIDQGIDYSQPDYYLPEHDHEHD